MALTAHYIPEDKVVCNTFLVSLDLKSLHVYIMRGLLFKCLCTGELISQLFCVHACTSECNPPKRPSLRNLPLAWTLFLSASSCAPLIHRLTEALKRRGRWGWEQIKHCLKREEEILLRTEGKMQSDDFSTECNCVTASRTHCLCITGKK